MTRNEATREAQRRWGSTGRAHKARGRDLFRVGRSFITGIRNRQRRFVQYGIGKTYEDAFRSAAPSSPRDVQN